MRGLLSAAFSAYRQHFWLIALLTLVVGLPSEVIYSYVYNEVLGEDSDLFLVYELPLLLVYYALSIVPTIGILHSLEVSASGGHPTLFSALRAGFTYWPRMAWTYLILGIIFVCGFVFLIVPAVIFAIRAAVAEQLVIREKISGLAVVEKSFALTKGRFWQLFWWFSIALIGTLLVSAPLFFTYLIPNCDWWLPEAISQTFLCLLLTFLTVFGWAVLNFLQEKELQRQPPPL